MIDRYRVITCENNNYKYSMKMKRFEYMHMIKDRAKVSYRNWTKIHLDHATVLE